MLVPVRAPSPHLPLPHPRPAHRTGKDHSTHTGCIISQVVGPAALRILSQLADLRACDPTVCVTASVPEPRALFDGLRADPLRPLPRPPHHHQGARQLPPTTCHLPSTPPTHTPRQSHLLLPSGPPYNSSLPACLWPCGVKLWDQYILESDQLLPLFVVTALFKVPTTPIHPPWLMNAARWITSRRLASPFAGSRLSPSFFSPLLPACLALVVLSVRRGRASCWSAPSTTCPRP